MGAISKALAGGLGAALSKVAVTVIKHFFPDVDSNSIEYIIYTLLTGLTVYAAPANSPSK